ncbi:MAG: AAA family ATPase [Rhodocyclaceae bacterium]|nr:AAA family ATPase [Rhodocyclaceae bacterium]
MFHIKTLEVVHWDYWQRFSLPLDAQIVTIVGPNGSGKTTLLDALRTLFALRCSGKRDFRRYVRRSRHGFAWIRAVVANQAAPGGKRPFFPCMKDEVTLACRIRRAGGDWTRDYAIVDGDLPIESLEEQGEWAGLKDYQNRLAWGGLTPAIAKVLSLEQGDTDKLCEYSPRALLDLVFDVFGDKEVLDNYQSAREEQNNADREMASLGLDLERLRAQAEARKQEANRYLEWRSLHDESLALESEIVPRLEASELSRQIASERGDLSFLIMERQSCRLGLEVAKALLERVQREKQEGDRLLAEVRGREQAAEDAHTAARDRVRDGERLLDERDKLRARVAAEHGQDALALEQDFAATESELTGLRQEERHLQEEFEQKAEALRAARDRRGPPSDPEVARFRRLLQDAGIAHRSLSEIVEVADAGWQPALEAVLKPYRHVILLEKESDRFAAWALGERERFRHFVVAEREAVPQPRPGSLAEVVRFAEDAPRWLAELLNRMRRVEDADSARDLPREQEWITRDGYHRERRGARHLGRPADFHFGELARQARIEQLEKDIGNLDRSLSTLRPRLEQTNERFSALRSRLLGLQSAQLLASRSADYAEAEAALPRAREAQAAALAERSELQSEAERARDRVSGIRVELERRSRDQNSAEERLKTIETESSQRRYEQAQRIQRLRRLRRGMPRSWRTAESLAPLIQHYGDARGARNELGRLKDRLETGEWIKDESVLALRDRMAADVEQRENDYRERQGYCASARRISDEARAAYIAKLRATVRQYGKNLRALGELAHVEVECPAPSLENDDAALARAGLEVRFDFDRKGAVGLNDGEASGGQQVMKSLILLIALLMDESRPGGFVFIDEPFAHLDVANIDRVGSFLRATRAQYLITTPVTHNANVFAPAQLTLVTRKKAPGEEWAPAIGVLKRMQD